jgi:Fe2+ transport system protein FeoA
MKLSETKLNERVKVTKIDLEKSVYDRLKSIGLTEGVKLTVIRRAPLGDPIEINLRGFYLAVRLSLADKITVTKL